MSATACTVSPETKLEANFPNLSVVDISSINLRSDSLAAKSAIFFSVALDNPADCALCAAAVAISAFAASVKGSPDKLAINSAFNISCDVVDFIRSCMAVPRKPDAGISL